MMKVFSKLILIAVLLGSWAQELNATMHCGIAVVTKVGCYADNYQPDAKRLNNIHPIPNMLFTDHIKTSKLYSGVPYPRKKVTLSYIRDYICRCAERTLATGSSLFGLQHYGECWSGKTAHLTYKKHGRSNDCMTADFKTCENKELCIGEDNANFVLTVKRIKGKNHFQFPISSVPSYTHPGTSLPPWKDPYPNGFPPIYQENYLEFIEGKYFLIAMYFEEFIVEETFDIGSLQFLHTKWKEEEQITNIYYDYEDFEGVEVINISIASPELHKQLGLLIESDYFWRPLQGFAYGGGNIYGASYGGHYSNQNYGGQYGSQNNGQYGSSYRSQYGNQYGSPYGNQYRGQYDSRTNGNIGSSYGQRGQYGSQYGSPYGNQYGGQYGRRRPGQYGFQFGNKHGTQYGSLYGSQYSGQYGSQHGGQYGSSYGKQYRGQYGGPYGGHFGSHHANQYGSQYGSQYPGQYGVQYGIPYDNQHQSQYSSQLGSHYGTNHANQYGSQYGNQHPGQYGSPYGSQFGSRYGGHYGNQYRGHSLPNENAYWSLYGSQVIQNSYNLNYGRNPSKGSSTQGKSPMKSAFQGGSPSNKPKFEKKKMRVLTYFKLKFKTCGKHLKKLVKKVGYGNIVRVSEIVPFRHTGCCCCCNVKRSKVMHKVSAKNANKRKKTPIECSCVNED